MLGRNHVLEYVDVTAHRGTGHKRNQNGLHPLHHSVTICKPLSLACRLAFISVINGSTSFVRDSGRKRTKREASPSRREPPHLPKALDRRLVSAIFEFAAPLVRRCVYIRYHGQAHGYGFMQPSRTNYRCKPPEGTL